MKMHLVEFQCVRTAPVPRIDTVIVSTLSSHRRCHRIDAVIASTLLLNRPVIEM